MLTLALICCLVLSAAGCGGGGGDSSEGAVKDTLDWVQNADVTSLDRHIGKETPAVTVS